MEALTKALLATAKKQGCVVKSFTSTEKSFDATLQDAAGRLVKLRVIDPQSEAEPFALAEAVRPAAAAEPAEPE